jgi:hypothetical protein
MSRKPPKPLALEMASRLERGLDYYRPLSDNALRREMTYTCRQLYAIEHELRRRWMLEQDRNDRLAAS